MKPLIPLKKSFRCFLPRQLPIIKRKGKGTMRRIKLKKSSQGSKKTPSGRPGQVDFPFGQVTFTPSLPNGQGPRQAVH